MSSIPEASMISFHEEIKEAAVPWSRIAAGAGSLGGVGMGAGALIGAAHGGYSNYRDAREQGAGVGTSALSGVGGALSGGITGGTIGAGVGTLAGGALGAASPQTVHSLGESLNKTPYAGALHRFGQRQVHGLTGWTPEGGLESIRGGAWGAKDTLRKALEESPKNVKDLAGNLKDVDRAEKGVAAAEKATKMGLTNLPDYVKSLREHGVKKTLNADLANQFSNMSPAWQAATIGLPAASLAGSVLDKSDPEHKAEHVGSSIGQVAGGFVGSALPFIPGQLVLGGALGGAGKYLGRGVDKIRKRIPPVSRGNISNPEQQIGQHTPTERIMSPGAMGQPPEGMTA